MGNTQRESGRGRLSWPAVGLAALLATFASGPAHAWSVSGLGEGDFGGGSTLFAGGDSDGDFSMSDPLMGIGDRLNLEIESFSTPMMPPTPHLGSEILQFTQILVLCAVPIAALASQKNTSGNKPLLDNLLGGVLPLPGHPGAEVPPPVPEPRSIWLFAVSSAVLLAARARRRPRASEVGAS